LEQISHYRIISKLGAGGMGEVYRARDDRLGRDVAIKVLPADFAKDDDRLRRFEQEARATSALNHPNILTVYDIGTHEDEPYIVAELLEPVRAVVSNDTSYTVTADGQRFLFVSPGAETASLQYTVVVNWTAEAKR
jgi:hypothetical protein